MNCRVAVTAGALTVWLTTVLTGCTAVSPPPDPRDLAPTPLLLLGELHDAPEHQALQRDTVHQLAQRGQLAAVVLEMVEQDHSTARLSPNASEAQVREALDWRAERNAGAWPWNTYGPVIMAAVRAGVPVVGGNLPRTQMRAAMGDTALDQLLPEQTLQEQRQAIRDGHCGLLPESQIAPMTRIQLARDRSMADTAVSQQRDTRTVLLIAGNGHVLKELVIPRHLPTGLAHRVIVTLSRDAESALGPGQADRVWLTPPRPPKDHCADMKPSPDR